jgi:hypothetical protein
MRINVQVALILLRHSLITAVFVMLTLITFMLLEVILLAKLDAHTVLLQSIKVYVIIEIF